MACWSDLPAELRFEILRYLFVNTITSHRPSGTRHCEQMPHILSLVLVSRSFVHYKDVIQAMLSETTLRLRSDCDTSRISSDPRYVAQPLDRLRSLEIAESFKLVQKTNLEKLKSMLPSLNRIQVRVQGVSFPSLYLSPRIAIPAGFGLDPHLMAAAWHWQHSEPPHQFLISPSSSMQALPDNIRAAAQQIDVTEEYNEDPTYRSICSLAISESLTHRTYLDDSDVAPARWLAQLLTDALKKDTKVIVTLSWALEITVLNLLPGPEDIEFIIRPAFFSTKDMCIRFGLGFHEGFIAQIFPDSLRTFALGGA